MLDGKPLRSAASNEGILYQLRSGVALRLAFEHGGSLFVLESQIELNLSPSLEVAHWMDALGFKDEKLYRWMGSKVPNKSLLSNIDALIEGSEIYLQRSKMTEMEKSLLSHNVSIATAITGRSTLCLYQSNRARMDGCRRHMQGKGFIYGRKHDH